MSLFEAKLQFRHQTLWSKLGDNLDTLYLHLLIALETYPRADGHISHLPTSAIIRRCRHQVE